MHSVKDLIALADHVAKLEALATAAQAAESCTLAGAACDPSGFTGRRDVTLTFTSETAARAFADALQAAVKPAAPAHVPPTIQMSTRTPYLGPK